MYIYLYVYLYICTVVYLYICVYIHTYIHILRICVYTCTYAHAYACVSACVRARAHARVCACATQTHTCPGSSLMFSALLAQQLRNTDVFLTARGKAAQSIQNANWDAGGLFSASVCTGRLRCTSRSLTLPAPWSRLAPRCVLIPLTSKLGIGGRVDFEPLLLLQARGERWKSGRDGRLKDPRHGAHQSPAAAARAARSMHVKDACPRAQRFTHFSSGSDRQTGV